MKRETTNCRKEGEIQKKGRPSEGNVRRNGMSEELWQNARQTMGEMRDMMRATGISWEFIEREIERGKHRPTGIDRALESMDQYSTGYGRRLRGLPNNI